MKVFKSYDEALADLRNTAKRYRIAQDTQVLYSQTRAATRIFDAAMELLNVWKGMNSRYIEQFDSEPDRDWLCLCVQSAQAVQAVIDEDAKRNPQWEEKTDDDPAGDP